MLDIKKLVKPNKRSGFNLPVGESTKIRGLVVTNVSAGPRIFVDKYTPKKRKARRKK